MDYKKVLEDCNTRAEVYQRQDAAWNLLHERQCAEAISNLIVRAEAAEARAAEAKKERESVTELSEKLEASKQRCDMFLKMVQIYQTELIPGYRKQADKAVRELGKAIDCLLKIEMDLGKEYGKEAAAMHIAEWSNQREE